jgi:hypothetical protein
MSLTGAKRQGHDRGDDTAKSDSALRVDQATAGQGRCNATTEDEKPGELTDAELASASGGTDSQTRTPDLYSKCCKGTHLPKVSI